MKKFLYIMSALFFIGLAVVIGLRMSPDAMAVIVGIICGMIATVPTTLLLVYTIRQRDKQQMMYQQNYQQGNQYPPVVVVNGQPQGSSYGFNQGLSTPGLPMPDRGRAFKVVGQEATPTDTTLGDAFGLSSIWDEGNNK